MTGTTNQTPDAATLGALFHRASRLMARAHHRRNHAHHAQSRILSIIKDRDGSMRQGDLLELLDVRSSSLSEVLRKLELGGLVRRERSEEDKRSFLVALTPEAETLLAEQHDARLENGDALFACLDEEERECLGRILEKLILSLQDDPECREPRECPRPGRGRRGECQGDAPHGRQPRGRDRRGPGTGRGGGRRRG